MDVGILLHHDPGRSGTDPDEIQIENKNHFRQHYDNNKSYCAAEGIKITSTRQITGGITVIEVE